jgi:hypothetical protein
LLVHRGTSSGKILRSAPGWAKEKSSAAVEAHKPAGHATRTV